MGIRPHYRRSASWAKMPLRAPARVSYPPHIEERSVKSANFTDMPRIARAVRRLPGDRALIDGEAVAFRPDGHSDFAALRTKADSAQACFVAFDVLTLEGDDYRSRFSKLVAGINGILFSESISAEGALALRKRAK